MLHWRGDKGGETLFRCLTVAVFVLSLYRFKMVCSKIYRRNVSDASSLVSPSIQVTEPCDPRQMAERACLNPPKHMFQSIPETGKVQYIALLMYGISLDIVLQILGPAAVWGSTECFGFRGKNSSGNWTISDESSRNLSYFFSVIAAMRYIWRTYKYYSHGNMRLVSPSYNSLDNNIVDAKVSWWKSKISAVVYSFGVSFCSLSEASRILTGLIKSRNTVTSHAALAGRLEMGSFVLGGILHCSVRIVLEFLGAAGAIWGISEVFMVRGESNSGVFSTVGEVACVVVFIRLTSRWLAKILRKSSTTEEIHSYKGIGIEEEKPLDLNAVL